MTDTPKLSHCADYVRRHDRDRFLCTLFAAPEKRESLFTLYAFNQEVSKTREMVSEVMLERGAVLNHYKLGEAATGETHIASLQVEQPRDSQYRSINLNTGGGLVGFGHPVGATGAILTVKLMHELERTGGRFGLVSLCIGGGQGIATIFERIS